MRLRHILPILHIIAILLPQGAGAECGGDTLRHAGGGGPAAVERARAAVDSLLDRIGWQKSTRADTAYITRTAGRLRLKLTLNGSGSDIDTRWSSGGESFRSRLKAQNKYTTSITASYRGLSLSVAFNPARLSGRNKDYELNLNAYGNRFGADLILQSTKTYEGSVSTPAGGEAAVAAGGVSQDMITASAYYVFSGRRFSFPAAFTQSWIQQRSHGSFMLGVSFIGGRIKTEAPDVIGSSVSRLTVVSAGVGAGYAHNWVVKRRWLLHISTLPQFIVFMLLFLAAKAIYPLTTPDMIADFKACGGFLLIATGFRIAKIREFPIADMLPAMVLVMPLSALWTQFITPLL